MSTTTFDHDSERSIRFPAGLSLDRVQVGMMHGTGEPLWLAAEQNMEFTSTDVLALMIGDHQPGTTAGLLDAFDRGTFQLVHIASGAVSELDLMAVGANRVSELRLGNMNGRVTELKLEIDGDAFACCSELRSLSAFHCAFTNDHLAGLQSLRSLRTLVLVDTEVTSTGLNTAEMPGLSSLVIGDPLWTLYHWSSFSGWGGLGELTVEKVGWTDQHLANVAMLPGLQILRLAGNDVFRRSFPWLDELTDLVWLDLARTRINDDTIDSIEGLRQLRHLDLSATAITDSGLAALSGVHRLEQLYLGSCDITDDGLARIVDEHPHLKVLDISRTLVTADAVPLLTKLTDLWRLELSQPSFSKPLLEAIDDFASLEEFGFRGQEASMGDPDIGELLDWYGAANWIPTR